MGLNHVMQSYSAPDDSDEQRYVINQQYATDSDSEEIVHMGVNPRCVLSCTTSNRCYKCQVEHLNNVIRQLTNELKYIKNQSHDILSKHYHSRAMICHNFFSNSDKPLEYDYKDVLSNTYFITITFDPSKFGVENQDTHQKVYILYQLQELARKELMFSCYGSFEKQKNGTIHAHVIVHSNHAQEIRQFLKRKFTDNPHNKSCIDVGKAKYPQAKQYIEKSTEAHYGFFKWPNPTLGLDDNLV